MEVLQQIFCEVPQCDALGALPLVNRQFRAALCIPSPVWEELSGEVLTHLSGI